MTKRFGTTFLLLLLFSTTAFAQFDDVESRPQVQVTDADIDAGDDVTWTRDNVYVLDGLVIVEEGAVLRIESGTVIKAENGTGLDASALVVARGGRIFAEGTAAEPIIFTSVEDNISGPDALTYQSRGRWGGVVLLGRATTNSILDPGGTPVYREVEGVNEIVPEGDPRDEYGGTDDDDSSGIIRYVSIRHTGINVGAGTGNEIQGLTLGGVGRGTVIEYVESYASADDGFEFFGGTVNTKYLVSAFNADDAFDYDEGWRGNNQFWFALQGTDEAGGLAEQDGGLGDVNGEDAEPYSTPTIYNATFIGAGVGATPASDRAEALIFRDNAGGGYFNSIIYDFETLEGGYGLTIENLDGDAGDSQARFVAGDLRLTNNIWYGFGEGDDPSSFVQDDDGNAAGIAAYLTSSNNYFVDPELGGVDRATIPSGGLDPRPHAGSPALTRARADYPAGDPFYTPVDYIGAFGQEPWLQGWTALDLLGYLGDLVDPNVGVEPVDDEIPNTFSLDQNYPNPFNPTTRIEFALERTQRVRLAVYDLLGREVAVLIDGVQPAGTFRAAFEAQDLASGMYHYRLTTDSGSITRTMMLVK